MALRAIYLMTFENQIIEGYVNQLQFKMPNLRLDVMLANAWSISPIVDLGTLIYFRQNY